MKEILSEDELEFVVGGSNVSVAAPPGGPIIVDI